MVGLVIIVAAVRPFTITETGTSSTTGWRTAA